jgi:hypothetical protein
MTGFVGQESYDDNIGFSIFVWIGEDLSVASSIDSLKASSKI